MTPVRALLDRLIDYAGLFPPAALDMPAAVEQYAAHRRGSHTWMLGRFIVPLARLPELRRAAAAIPDSSDWPLSVLALPGDPLPPEVDSVELKIARAEDIRHSAGPPPPLRYFEIPLSPDPRPLLAALADSGARAKIRTGGLTPEAYPAVPDLARFLQQAVALRVPFKATAGLHHPLPSPPMHGFLNLFLAAALAFHGGAQDDLAATLREPLAPSFRHDPGGIGWHLHRLTLDQILSARADFAIAFGSCSFDEPVADLQALGWLSA